MAVTVTNEKDVNKEMGIEEGEEKWVKHYSSNHQILLVGDGDFSFSLSLALSFGSASNIVASSLDSYVEVITKYKNGESNLQKLEELGASHLHGVDATKMKLHSDLKMRKFDRIIFSFPHAGFWGKEDDVRLINMHKKLVSSFFANACCMLRPYGEIHVNHKTTPPFCCWNLEEHASEYSLALTECVDFRKEDYPGYSNKRGDGSKCDETFWLGKCSTFMFRFIPSADKFRMRPHVCSKDEISLKPPQAPSPIGRRFEQPREVPFQVQQRPLCDLTFLRNGRSFQSQEAPQAPSPIGRRFEQPREVPFQVQQRPLCDLTFLRNGRSFQSQEAPQAPSPIGRRFEQPREVPFQVQQRPLCDLTFLRNGRSFQSQEAPFRNQQLVASFGRDPQESHYKMKEMVASFGHDPSMSDIRSHTPQAAPYRMKHPSPSFGSETSMSDIPFNLRTRTHTQEQPSSFDYIARNTQLNDRDSWTHRRTYPVRDQGPSLHYYERFLQEPRNFRR